MSNGLGITVALVDGVSSDLRNATSHPRVGTVRLAKVWVTVLIVLAPSAAGALQVERELEEVRLLARQSRHAEAIAKLEGVIARLERLADLDARRTPCAQGGGGS